MDAISAGLGLINTAANIGANAAFQDQQHRNNLALMQTQYKYGEKAANAADARQRAQYNDLYSAKAKREQLEEAGLSVGLMYGQNGVPGGGTAGAAQGGGAGLPSESAPYGNYFDLLGAEKIKAEIDNIKADTEEKEGEEGRKKELHEFNMAELVEKINNLIADTDNKKEQTGLTNLQTQFQKTQNAIEEIKLSSAEAISRAELRNLKLQGDSLEETIEGLKKSNAITDAQYNELIKQAYLQNQLTLQTIAEKKIGTRKTQAEIKNITEATNLVIQQTIKTHWEGVNEYNFEYYLMKQLESSKDLQELIGDQQERMAYIKAITSVISAGTAAVMFKGGGGKFIGVQQSNFYD